MSAGSGSVSGLLFLLLLLVLFFLFFYYIWYDMMAKKKEDTKKNKKTKAISFGHDFDEIIGPLFVAGMILYGLFILMLGTAFGLEKIHPAIWTAIVISCLVVMEVGSKIWIKGEAKDTKYKPFTYSEIAGIKLVAISLFASLALWAVSLLGLLFYGIYILLKDYVVEVLTAVGIFVVIILGTWLFLHLNKKWLDKVAAETYEEYSEAKESLESK